MRCVIISEVLTGKKLDTVTQYDMRYGLERIGYNNEQSCVFMVEVLTGEDWDTIMHNAIISQGGLNQPGAVVYSIYFVVLIIIGSCILYIRSISFTHSNYWWRQWSLNNRHDVPSRTDTITIFYY